MEDLNFAEKWLENAYGIMKYIEETQIESINKAAEIIANSIASGHVCFLFGSGHAAIPVMEIFPRYGTVLGFMPIVDLPLVAFLRIVGDMGYPQFDFIENSPEYGRRILENYEIHKEDCALLFSHSGTTPITIEVARVIKDYGAKIIVATSLKHSMNTESRHPSKLKLYELADIVIDTGVPLGDVSIKIKDLDSSIGPLSTFAFIIVANMLLLKTIEKLMIRGMKPMIFPVRRLNPRADEIMRQLLLRYRELYSKHLRKQ